jgi:hypothetical protein
MTSKRSRYPAGWNEERVNALLRHYEEQTEDEAVAEDEAAFRKRDQTVMVVPRRLVPAITRLITREKTLALRQRLNKGLHPSASRAKRSSGSKAISRLRRLKP